MIELLLWLLIFFAIWLTSNSPLAHWLIRLSMLLFFALFPTICAVIVAIWHDASLGDGWAGLANVVAFTVLNLPFIFITWPEIKKSFVNPDLRLWNKS